MIFPSCLKKRIVLGDFDILGLILGHDIYWMDVFAFILVSRMICEEKIERHPTIACPVPFR